MADLFQDCEIKSYLYFGPDHYFLSLICCVRVAYVFAHMYYVQCVCDEESICLHSPQSQV